MAGALGSGPKDPGFTFLSSAHSQYKLIVTFPGTSLRLRRSARRDGRVPEQQENKIDGHIMLAKLP